MTLTPEEAKDRRLAIVRILDRASAAIVEILPQPSPSLIAALRVEEAALMAFINGKTTTAPPVTVETAAMHNEVICAEIDRIERAELAPRPLRDIVLGATDTTTTKYQKMLDVENRLAALRAALL